MLTRTIVLFSFDVAAVLFGASQTDAQPGKGKGPGGFGGGGPDIQKLEKDLERLLEQVQETKAAIAKAKEAGKGKKGGFDGQKGFQGQKGEKGGPGGKGKGGPGGMWKGGFGGFGPKGFESKKGEKLDPDTIKEKYEFYKKLYDELPKAKGPKGKGFEGKGKGKGKGFEKKEPMPEPKGKGGKGGPPPMAGGGRSVESRIDALIRELELLRNEVKGKKK